ncbi:MAG: nickel-dependent lactate racemase [Euryarchaeota archaeon]|nr:nickel-dependent lactate racemase [Euryarchaeota archaeon]
MVLVRVPYGDGHIEALVDAEVEVALPRFPAAGDGRAILREALAHPMASGGLEEFLTGRILCVVNDATRATPTAEILEVIYPQIKDRDLEFLVATGAHRAPTEEEYREIFGRRYGEFKERVRAHDARRDEMAYAGRTGRGTEVYINRRFWDADRILVIGSVEPHYYAGFTGGRKAIIPGLASFRTIEENHRLALEEGAGIMRLEGNPVEEDLEEALRLLEAKEIFSVTAVTDGHGVICAAYAGDLGETFRAAVETAKGVYSVRVGPLADVVVTATGPPMDKSLYQAHKALYNGALGLREALARGRDPRGVLALTSACYRLGYQTAVSIARLALRYRVWGVTGLARGGPEEAFIRPSESFQTALDEALRGQEGARVLVLPYGPVTVPVPQPQ